MLKLSRKMHQRSNQNFQKCKDMKPEVFVFVFMNLSCWCKNNSAKERIGKLEDRQVEVCFRVQEEIFFGSDETPLRLRNARESRQDSFYKQKGVHTLIQPGEACKATAQMLDDSGHLTQQRKEVQEFAANRGRSLSRSEMTS